MDSERIVAVGLLSEKELAMVGQTLRRVFMVDEDGGFDELLRKIDVADTGNQGTERSLGR